MVLNSFYSCTADHTGNNHRYPGEFCEVPSWRGFVTACAKLLKIPRQLHWHLRNINRGAHRTLWLGHPAYQNLLIQWSVFPPTRSILTIRRNHSLGISALGSIIVLVCNRFMSPESA
jgi:hypothetical protein